ncbi:MAG TPA: tetratricopeptide repeat protein [Acidobacteriota bacterium]
MMRWMSRRAAVLVVLIAATVGAQSPDQAAAAGNRAYEAGDFNSAARRFEQALRYGAGSGALYYNLGNAYFKLGRLGEAILAYERARKQLGDDPDLRYNLDYARSLIVDQIEVAEENVYFKGLRYVHQLLSPNQTAAVFLGGYLVTALLGLGTILSPFPWRRRLGIAALVLAIPTLLIGISLSAKIYSDRAFEHGIVLEQKVYARSGPGANHTSIFEIHEGLKVEIHARRAGWTQISLANGFNGWVPENAIGTI